MSRDPRSLGEPTRRPDPVAEFFAGERGAVIDRPGSDEHWAEVLMLAQVAPRRRRRGYVAAAAAAVVIAVAITLSQSTPELEPPSSIPSSPGMSTTLPSGTTTGPFTVTSPPTATTQPVVVPPTTRPGDTPSTGTPAPGTSGLAFPAPVPGLQQVLAVTNAGDGQVYALATAACPQACPVVVGSSDNGATWRLMSQFPGYAAAGSGPVISGVRFATPRIGFAYGSTVLRTVDGGLTWQPLPYGGGTVLSLETDQSIVWIVTGTCAGGPTSGACSGIRVHRAMITAAATSHVDVPSLTRQPSAAWAARAWLALDRSTAYLNISGRLSDRAGFTATRISGSPAEIGRSAGCDPAAPLMVAPTANGTGTLFGLCTPAGAAGNRAAGYQVARSTDGGATWQARQGAALGPVTSAGPTVTGVSAQVLVGITGDGQLVRSGDGGATWVVAGRGGTLPGRGWGWVGAAGGGLVYAVHDDSALYVSTDHGQSFAADPTVRR